MKINILFLGDVSGEVGLIALQNQIPRLKEKHDIDLIVANAENASHNFGLTEKEYDILMKCGVDAITLGNHAFDKMQIFKILSKKNLAIPANWSPTYIGGNKTIMLTAKGKKIAITNLLGITFMPTSVNNPYETYDEILKKFPADYYLVDFHAESHAEKYAFAYCYNGVISALVGTHTHIQTIDARILPLNQDLKNPKQTLYISDIGMNGPYNSVIGVKINEPIFRGKTGLKSRLIPGELPYQFCGVILTIDCENKESNINRIYIIPGDADYTETYENKEK